MGSQDSWPLAGEIPLSCLLGAMSPRVEHSQIGMLPLRLTTVLNRDSSTPYYCFLFRTVCIRGNIPVPRGPKKAHRRPDSGLWHLRFGTGSDALQKIFQVHFMAQSSP